MTRTGLVLGGNKDLLFNIEQNINIMSQLRVILFYDAGQVRDVGQHFAAREKESQFELGHYGESAPANRPHHAEREGRAAERGSRARVDF